MGARRIIILSNRAALVELQKRVDAALGYPKAGVNIGGGVHAPPNVTLHHAEIEAHPNGTQWAYAVDSDSTSAVAQVKAQCVAKGAAGTADEKAIAAMPAVQDMTPDWVPAKAPGQP